MREVFGIGCMDARGVLATVGSEGNLAGFWQDFGKVVREGGVLTLGGERGLQVLVRCIGYKTGC